MQSRIDKIINELQHELKPEYYFTEEAKSIIQKHLDEVRSEAIAETIISENKKQVQHQKFKT